MTAVTDHRATQTPVRDQGDRPTCVAFAVSAAHEWRASDRVVRSAEDAMWAAHQVAEVPGREETTVSWALEGLRRHAHATEQAWPYGAPRWSDGRPAPALDEGNRRALPPWSDLGAATYQTIADQVKDGHPIVLTLGVVPAAWYHGGDVIDAPAGGKMPGNHAVLAVGSLESPERLVIKNSWGPVWGDSGYGLVTRRYYDHYALRAHILEAA
ncbi:MAG: C1 family peptidase [Propionibacteriales bacterium]|nr:C1 family peptidase [Propionibacteriales bacterium]